MTTMTKNTMHGLFVGLTGDTSRARAMRIVLQEKRATATQTKARLQGSMSAPGTCSHSPLRTCSAGQ